MGRSTGESCLGLSGDRFCSGRCSVTMTFLKNYYESAGISSGANNLSLRTCSSVFVELIALLVGHPGDTRADQHGRSDQNQASTLERRNPAGTGPRRLRIAER